MNDLRVYGLDFPFGRLGVALTDTGVARVLFEGAEKRGGEEASIVEGQLAEYFAGERQQFTVPLDLRFAGTPFQRAVLGALMEIPYGETTTYSELAARVGKPRAVRAVGSACGANPLPIIVPCHRVLRSDGSLGGYAGGLPWKKHLLELEGHVFHENGNRAARGRS